MPEYNDKGETWLHSFNEHARQGFYVYCRACEGHSFDFLANPCGFCGSEETDLEDAFVCRKCGEIYDDPEFAWACCQETRHG